MSRAFFAFLSSATVASPAPSQAAVVDESAFFAPLDELALLANASTAHFRFRTVRYPEHSPDAAPSKIRDGLVRVHYDGAGLALDEHFVDLVDADAHEPVVQRVRSYHSLASGEYVRAAALPGGVRDTAFVDRWEGVPAVFFFAAGLVAARGMLADSSLVERAPRDGAIRRASFASVDGRRWTLTYDATSPGTALSLESVASDGAFTDWVIFEQHRDGLPGLPRQPQLVTQSRIDKSGAVGTVFVWQRVERSESDDGAARLATGTRIDDLRGGETRSTTLDRPMELRDVLTWAGLGGTRQSTAILELDAAALRSLTRGEDTPRSSTRTAWFVAALGLGAICWWRMRRRTA